MTFGLLSRFLLQGRGGSLRRGSFLMISLACSQAEVEVLPSKSWILMTQGLKSKACSGVTGLALSQGMSCGAWVMEN